MGRSFWYNKWQQDKCFIVENDILKDKAYVYTSYPKMNQYGFQTFNIRRLILADAYARYLRMRDMNVLFPVGFHSLGNSSFIESKRNSNVLDDKIQKIFYKQMLELGIGINENKLIDMRSDEFVGILQLAFIEMYERGYIEYKPYMVYYDKDNNKIYDSLNLYQEGLSKTRMNCFVLKIKDLIPNIIKDINKLACPVDLKNKLIKALEPKDIMRLSLSVSNNNRLEVEMTKPWSMGGIAFIFLNPEYIDITGYVSIDEYYQVMDYLENGTSDFAYTGLFAINPLTGKEIPIFISTIYEERAHLGIPYLNARDKEIAIDNEFQIIEIMKNNTLINSDLIDGYTIEKGQEKIIEAFSEAEICEVVRVYQKDEILLSSLDGFGPLFPYLIERDNKLNSLKAYLPYNFSRQFRPVLSSEVNILGNELKGTINNLFVDGMSPIIAMLYDELSQIESLFSEASIKEIKSWGTIKDMIIAEDSYISELLMPIIIHNVIKKEIGELPDLFKVVIPISKSVDSGNRDIKRSNNNLIDFNRILSSYYADTIRLYTLSEDLNSPLRVDLDKLLELDKMVIQLEERLMNASDMDNRKLDFYFYSLQSDLKQALDNNDLSAYSNEIIEFIKNVILEEPITKDECFIFIKAIYPVMPFLAEEVYSKLFNGKHSLINESF